MLSHNRFFPITVCQGQEEEILRLRESGKRLCDCRDVCLMRYRVILLGSETRNPKEIPNRCYIKEIKYFWEI